MIMEVDPSLNPADLLAPTDAEIEELSKRVSPESKARLDHAARALLVAKMMAHDTTPWRDLVEAYRASDPVRVEVEIVEDDGVPRVQVAYIERGFGLKGSAAVLHSSVGDFVRALDVIDKERERNRRNGAKGGRRSSESKGEEIAAFLRRRDYENSGNKKALRIEAADFFKVGLSTITNAITEHGLARRR